MAADTPRLSVRDRFNQHYHQHYHQQCDQQYDQFVQRQLDEVASEREAAVGQLNTTIAENTKLKNAYASCWHVIAIKQDELNAVHDQNWQLQRDLDRERQTNKELRSIVSLQETTHHNTRPQNDTTTSAIAKHRETITIDGPIVSTAKDHQNDNVTTPEDATAESDSDVEIIEVDNAGSPLTAPKKRRKKQTKRVWPATQAAQRPRRDTKPGMQEQAANPDAVQDVPIFFVDYKDEIVGEDGNALSQDVQAAFNEQMTELSTKERSPRGHWSFAEKKGNCVRCTVSNQTSYWTVQGPRQYTCRTCANADGICILWDEEASKYRALPLPPQFAGEGLHQFKFGSAKRLSRSARGKNTWPTI